MTSHLGASGQLPGTPSNELTRGELMRHAYLPEALPFCCSHVDNSGICRTFKSAQL